MAEPVIMAELWRGSILESVHRGHGVVVRDGNVMAAWGDPGRVIFPRSSAKMLQALPLVESGAADMFGLGTEQLALACASHSGAPGHTTRVSAWLSSIGLKEADLRCGPQVPDRAEDRQALRDAGEAPCQLHNNCSGKHSGFLTLGRHLGAGPEYVEPDHPVQKAALAAFEEMTGETSPGYGIDGCSAPNFATTVAGLARAAAAMTNTKGKRGDAARRLVEAMMAHPELVAGEGLACTEMMQVMDGVAVKTGAEGVFVAIAPAQRLGVALKIEDGATRASEAAMAAILIHLGLLEEANPLVQKRLNAVHANRRGIPAAYLRATDFADRG